MNVNPVAGKPAEPAMLVNVPRLVTAYYTGTPDASLPEQRVAFGTSGHLGSALETSFLRLEGTVWMTDKDGIIPALLAAEITARMGRDPGEIYQGLTREFGAAVYDRVEAPATPEQKAQLARLSPEQVKLTELAGEKIVNILTHAPGNGSPIGGLKVIAANGWFAARPSGTEDIYKIYAESFQGEGHLHRILEEAQTIVDAALAVEPKRDQGRAFAAVHQQTASEAKEAWRNEGNPN